MRNRNRALMQKSDTVLNKIISLIQQNKNFLITAHDNLDGDAFGSGLALCFALEKLGKKAKFILKTPVPERYKFLPGIEKFTATEVDLKKYNVIFVLDTAGWGQLEQLSPKLFNKSRSFQRGIRPRWKSYPALSSPQKATGFSKKGRDKYTVVNIDHHVDNLQFGDINWVETKASAVGEQIYVLLRYIKTPITKEIAECLYTSILTDTGCFQFTNTTSETHLIIGDLIRSRIYPTIIYEQIYENMSLARLNLLKYALGTLKTDSKNQIIWLWITQKMFNETGATRADTEGFIDEIKAVDGVKVAIIFKESTVKDEIRVTFRSRVPSIKVNQIAHKFNGGGHPAAAGCTVKGSNKEVERKVIEAVKIILKKSQ